MSFPRGHRLAQALWAPVAALDGIDLSVPAVSRTAIVGPSGCGKTTLLRLIAGFGARWRSNSAQRRAAGRLSSMRFRRHRARHRRGDAGWRPVPPSQHRRQYRLRAEPERAGPGAAHRRARLYGGARRIDPAAPPAPAVRRPAAAGGIGQGHGAAAQPDAARRTVLGARHGAARQHARGGRRTPRTSQNHHHPRHT